MPQESEVSGENQKNNNIMEQSLHDESTKKKQPSAKNQKSGKFTKQEPQKRQSSFLNAKSCFHDLFLFDVVSFLNKYVKLSQMKNTIELDDISYLGEDDNTQQQYENFQSEIDKFEDKSKLTNKHIFKIMFDVFKKDKKIIYFCVIYYMLSKFLNSVMINFLLKALKEYLIDKENKTEQDSQLRSIIIYVVVMVLCLLTNCIALHYANKKSFALTGKIRSVFLTLIYEKITQMSQYKIKDANIGKLVNLASNDFNMIEIKLYPMFSFFCLPLAFLIGCIILSLIYGPIGLLAIVFLLVGVILQICFSARYQKYAMERSNFNDTRIKLCSEMIEGIRLIKMYTWEGEFTKMIEEVRKKELGKTFFMFFFQLVGKTINMSLGFFAIVTFLAILYHNDFDEHLTTAKIFTTLDLIQFLKFQLIMGIFGILGYKEFLNIMERSKTIINMKSQEMLNMSEKEQNYKIQKELFEQKWQKGEHSILLQNFEAYWHIFSQEKEDEKQEENKDQKQDLKNETEKEKELDTIKKPVLQNINFEAKKGEHIAIIGKVGSGKSSFLYSFLNEIPSYKGHIKFEGQTAHVEQEPYIFNGSVQDNIILGLQYDPIKYQQVVNSCCLQQDLEELANGDQTEIGERGVNLSGGQKARLSLARAVYSDADIYLLDDPLSAVDAKVGKLIYENVICGLLKNKTVLLTTHQIHFTQKNMDKILILENGQIQHQGTFEEVKPHMVKIAGELNKNIMDENQQQEDEDEKQLQVRLDKIPILKQQQQQEEVENQNQQKLALEDESLSKASSQKTPHLPKYSQKEKQQQQIETKQQSLVKIQNPAEKQQQQQYQEQEEEIVNIKWTTYKVYLQNAAPAVFLILATSLLFIDGILYIVINNKIGDFEDSNDKEKLLAQIGYLSVLYLLSSVIRYSAWTFMHMNSVKNLQIKLIKALLRATTNFFDITASGSIINRFSNDTGITDIPLYACVADVVDIWSYCLMLLIHISIMNQWMIISMVIQLTFFALFLKRNKKILTQGRILELTNKSPLYTFFTTTLGGILPLRVYKQIDTFKSIFRNLVDNQQRSSYFFWFLSRGFAFSIQNMASLFSLLTIISLIILTINDGEPNTAKVGITIIHLLGISDIMQWGLRQTVALDVGLASVERIHNYTTKLPTERPYILNKVKKSQKGNQELKQIQQQQNLEKEGQIEFKNVTMKYREDLDPVLKNVSFKIESGLKIGCVGRTGAGKSSLLQALFRMQEMEDFDNKNKGIFINGNRIQDMGLKELRESISIIPQIPFTFSGTIRRNLDPIDEFSDSQIQQVLKDVDLYDTVNQLKDGIQTDMTNTSNVFSIGQKQLICLARTILRQNSIVVLDEATANIDMKTDELIQKQIKEKFHQNTVFTIAHRLNTIADYDKILVMDKGKVAEFDSPYNLLVKDSNNDQQITQNTIFAEMVKNTGPNNAQSILEIAKQHTQK